MEKRDVRLDVIRTAAIFFVIAVHFLDSSGFPGETMGGAWDYLMLCVWLLTHTCVPLFLMLSGWLLCGRELTGRFYRGLVRIVLIYLLCSAACLLFRALALHERMSPRYVFGSIVNFYACGYAWYVALYLGLFLMIPFLNAAYRGLETRGKKRALLATSVFLAVAPSLFNQFIQLYSNWWVRLYPICYYFIGAYLREYLPRPGGKKATAALFVSTAAFAGLDLLLYRGNAQAMIGVAYDHYQVFTVSVLLFLCLLAIPAPSAGVGRLFTAASRLSFAMYLLSWIPDRLLYPRLIAGFPIPEERCLWLLPCAAGVFLVSLGLAWIVQKLYEPLGAAVLAVIDKRKNKGLP